VLVIAGKNDVLAPKEAVEAVTNLLPNAAEVRYELAPGGHLAVLTGRSAHKTTWRHLDAFLRDHDLLDTRPVTQRPSSTSVRPAAATA
jgi:polyhydroxyalkanoate synthase